MAMTILVDLDHLLSVPVYDAQRCSIGFHPLHTYPMVGVYIILLFFPKSRLIALGLVVHMLLDGVDCVWMHSM